MPVAHIRAATLEGLGFLLPAIRTPEQFQAADERIGSILAGIRSDEVHLRLEELNEVKVLREALDSAPFTKLGASIVAKGFLPRIVETDS